MIHDQYFEFTILPYFIVDRTLSGLYFSLIIQPHYPFLFNRSTGYLKMS